jgi:hypothetical protein
MLEKEIRLVEWGEGHLRRVPDLWTKKDIEDVSLARDLDVDTWIHKFESFPERVLVGFNEESRWLSWEVCDWLMEHDLWDFTRGGRYQEYAD